jgi:hypothetical protein
VTQSGRCRSRLIPPDFQFAIGDSNEMTRFEFLMMIAAVVVAIGMTEIVGGWGRLMRTRSAVKPYWLHLGWTILILSSLIQYWIGMWSYSELQIERLGQIFFLIIPSLFGVLAAFAITPDVPDDGQLILRDYYWTKRTAIFLPLAVYFVTALVADFLIIGIENVEIDAASPHVIGTALISLLLLSTREWVHIAVLTLWTAKLIISMFA